MDLENEASISAEPKKSFFKKLILITAGAVLVLITMAFIGYFILKTFVVHKGETDIKIGFITDWEYEYRKDLGDKLTSQAPAEMEKAVKYLNEQFKPDFVVAGGDMIESTGVRPEKAKKQLREINAIFSKLDSPRGYVFGNHDLRSLSKEEVRNEIGLKDNHNYLDLGEWRLVLLDTNFKDQDETDLGPNRYISGFISENEFSWLKGVLDTKRPTIIFSHHSPIPSPNPKNLINREKTRNILNQFPNVVAVVSGHDPGFAFDQESGISYVIVNNLVKNNALGSFATIEAKYNKYTKRTVIKLIQHGMQEKEIEISKRLERNSRFEKFLDKIPGLASS